MVEPVSIQKPDRCFYEQNDRCMAYTASFSKENKFEMKEKPKPRYILDMSLSKYSYEDFSLVKKIAEHNLDGTEVKANQHTDDGFYHLTEHDLFIREEWVKEI